MSDRSAIILGLLTGVAFAVLVIVVVQHIWPLPEDDS